MNYWANSNKDLSIRPRICIFGSILRIKEEKIMTKKLQDNKNILKYGAKESDINENNLKYQERSEKIDYWNKNEEEKIYTCLKYI